MMKTLLTSTVTLAALAVAGSAFAQSAEGQVDISGSVAGKCAAIGSFADSEDLDELAGANGQLDTALSGTTALSPAFTKTFTVACTGANIGLSIEAAALDNTDVTTAPAGYSQTVNFTGRLDVDYVTNPTGDGTEDVSDDSSVSGATTDSLGSANFIANATGNVRVSAHSFNSGTDLLVAGDYEGSITVVLSPAT